MIDASIAIRLARFFTVSSLYREYRKPAPFIPDIRSRSIDIRMTEEDVRKSGLAETVDESGGSPKNVVIGKTRVRVSWWWGVMYERRERISDEISVLKN
jgi:hypothetical protein